MCEHSSIIRSCELCFGITLEPHLLFLNSVREIKVCQGIHIFPAGGATLMDSFERVDEGG